MKTENETVTLSRELPVVKCKVCGASMVNLDEHELHKGELAQLKKKGIRVSNPDTEEHICIMCEASSLKKKLKEWYEDKEDEDDSSFFKPSYTPTYRPSVPSPSSFGGFGIFKGFGGGGFLGGGAGRGF